MTDYVQTPGDRIDNLAKDVLVAGYLARDRKLTPDYADQLAERVRAAAADMIADGDRELLKAAADTLSRASTRIKAGAAARTRAKASNGSRHARPEPDWGALAHAEDLERMASAGPFSVNRHEESERRRAEVQNAQLRERQRRHEEQRAAQVEAARRPKGPGR